MPETPPRRPVALLECSVGHTRPFLDQWVAGGSLEKGYLAAKEIMWQLGEISALHRDPPLRSPGPALTLEQYAPVLEHLASLHFDWTTADGSAECAFFDAVDAVRWGLASVRQGRVCIGSEPSASAAEAVAEKAQLLTVMLGGLGGFGEVLRVLRSLRPPTSCSGAEWLQALARGLMHYWCPGAAEEGEPFTTETGAALNGSHAFREAAARVSPLPIYEYLRDEGLIQLDEYALDVELRQEFANAARVRMLLRSARGTEDSNAEPVPEPGACDTPDDPRRRESDAVGLLIQHPEWTVTDVARALGWNRTALYRSRLVKSTLEARRKRKEEERKELPRGYRDADGHIEAIGG